MPDQENAEVDEGQEAQETEETESTEQGDKTSEDAEPFDESRARAKISKANKEAKSLRDRLHAAEARLADIDNASKTDAERNQDRIKDLEEKYQAAEQRAMRLEVAQAKGLSAAQAKRLVGKTIEELETDADELLEAFGTNDKGSKKPPTKKPTENLRGGKDPEKEPELSGEQLAAAIDKRFRGF